MTHALPSKSRLPFLHFPLLLLASACAADPPALPDASASTGPAVDASETTSPDAPPDVLDGPPLDPDHWCASTLVDLATGEILERESKRIGPESEETWSDSPVGGPVEYRRHRDRNHDTRTVVEHGDALDDDLLDLRVTWTWDEDDHLLEVTSWSRPGNAVPVVWDLERDEEGRLVSTMVHIPNWDGSASLVLVVPTHDEQDRIVLEEYYDLADADRDGSPEDSEPYLLLMNFHDSEGRLARWEAIWADPGADRLAKEWTYDAAGRVLEERSEEAPPEEDWKLTYVKRTQWTPDGLLLSREDDREADGVFDLLRTFDYSCWSETDLACETHEDCTELVTPCSGATCGGGSCLVTGPREGAACEDGVLETLRDRCEASGACAGIPASCASERGSTVAWRDGLEGCISVAPGEAAWSYFGSIDWHPAPPLALAPSEDGGLVSVSWRAGVWTVRTDRDGDLVSESTSTPNADRPLASLVVRIAEGFVVAGDVPSNQVPNTNGHVFMRIDLDGDVTWSTTLSSLGSLGALTLWADDFVLAAGRPWPGELSTRFVRLDLHGNVDKEGAWTLPDGVFRPSTFVATGPPTAAVIAAGAFAEFDDPLTADPSLLFLSPSAELLETVRFEGLVGSIVSLARLEDGRFAGVVSPMVQHFDFPISTWVASGAGGLVALEADGSLGRTWVLQKLDGAGDVVALSGERFAAAISRPDSGGAIVVGHPDQDELTEISLSNALGSPKPYRLVRHPDLADVLAFSATVEVPAFEFGDKALALGLVVLDGGAQERR